jgi:hypothetical protein
MELSKQSNSKEHQSAGSNCCRSCPFGFKFQIRNQKVFLLLNRKLFDLRKEIKANLLEISYLEALGGKPIKQAKEDIEASIEVFDYYCNLIEQKDEIVKKQDFTTMTRRFPLGVVGLITSFNYPFCKFKLISDFNMENCAGLTGRKCAIWVYIDCSN